MSVPIDLSSSGIDFRALIDQVVTSGEPALLTQGGHVVAELRPSRPPAFLLSDLLRTLDAAPRLGAEEAHTFERDLVAAREQINQAGTPSSLRYQKSY